MTWGGQKFIFVTRGRAKPFTEEEAIKYLSVRPHPLEEVVHRGDLPRGREFDYPEEVLDALAKLPQAPNRDDDIPPYSTLKDVPIEGRWQIPDDKMRRHMFRADLAMGISFCVKKYGQSAEVIEAEAKRIASRS